MLFVSFLNKSSNSKRNPTSYSLLAGQLSSPLFFYETRTFITICRNCHWYQPWIRIIQSSSPHLCMSNFTKFDHWTLKSDKPVSQVCPFVTLLSRVLSDPNIFHNTWPSSCFAFSCNILACNFLFWVIATFALCFQSVTFIQYCNTRPDYVDSAGNTRSYCLKRSSTRNR